MRSPRLTATTRGGAGERSRAWRGARVGVVVGWLVAATSGCGRTSGDAPVGASPAPVSLLGAGASTVEPLLTGWASAFTHEFPDVTVGFRALGSAAGVRQVMSGSVDFGVTDVPLRESELERASRTLWQLPVAVTALAIVYQLPGVPELQLSPRQLADIYLGRVTRWDEPELAGAGGAVALPALPIRVVYRADGSGSSGVFTEYLTKLSPDWAARVGTGKSVVWPTGSGAKGAEGLAEWVAQTPGAIGYLEATRAARRGLSMAALETSRGQVVLPSPQGVAAAAAAAGPPDAELPPSLLDLPADQAYPLSSYSYVLVYENQLERPRGRALAHFLRWAMTRDADGGEELHAVALPAPLRERVVERLRRLRSWDQALLEAD